nr:LOW QUALITY PROTEIN: dopamine D2-like receptor [Lytechinus pictus]
MEPDPENFTTMSTMTTGFDDNFTMPYVNSTMSIYYNETDVVINFVLASIIGVCGFFGILGNSLVVISWAMSKKLQNITNIFIISLSITDFLGCAMLPIQVYTFVDFAHGSPVPDWVCKMCGALCLIAFKSSVCHLALIGINRYVVITRYRAQYLRLYSVRNVLIMVIFAWTFPILLIMLPPAVGLGHLGYNAANQLCVFDGTPLQLRIIYILEEILFGLSFIIILSCYFRIYVFINRQHRNLIHIYSKRERSCGMINVPSSIVENIPENATETTEVELSYSSVFDNDSGINASSVGQSDIDSRPIASSSRQSVIDSTPSASSPRQSIIDSRPSASSPRQSVIDSRPSASSPRQSVIDSRPSASSPRQSIIDIRSTASSPRQSVIDSRPSASSPRQSVIDSRSTASSPRQSVIDSRPSASSPRQSVIDSRPSASSPRQSIIDSRSTASSPRQSVIDSRPSASSPRQSVIDSRPSAYSLRQSVQSIRSKVYAMGDKTRSVNKKRRRAQSAQEMRRVLTKREIDITKNLFMVVCSFFVLCFLIFCVLLHINVIQLTLSTQRPF